MFHEPALEGDAEECCGRVGDGAAHRVVEAVGANDVGIGVDRFDVETCAGLECDLPVVGGNAGDDIVGSQCPAGSHEAVFDPDVGVVSGQGIEQDTVLGEEVGVGFCLTVENQTLVNDFVLQGEG